MCVIIIRPAGANLPTKKELKAAAAINHDGCGFVSETSHFKSLDFEDFYQHLKKVPKNENLIIHFRWATHGSVCERNCHPFYDKATKTWFAHNGVLGITPKGDTTDSETAFRSFLAPALQWQNFYSRNFAQTVRGIIGSSKFAFMQNGMLRTFGTFYEYGGRYYSNLRHLSVPARYAI